MRSIANSLVCHRRVFAVVIMMGSNDNAKMSIKTALKKMSVLGRIKLLKGCISQDHTKKSSSVYYNQALMLYLKQAMSVKSLNAYLKYIETECGRRSFKNTVQYNYLVTMDLDIMAIKMGNDWQMIAERLPLKAFEKKCLVGFMPVYNPPPQGRGR